MNKIVLSVLMCGCLSGCIHTEYVEKPCPVCQPDPSGVMIVTECSDYQDTELNNRQSGSNRYCVDKIYLNGVEITNPQTASKRSVVKSN